MVQDVVVDASAMVDLLIGAPAAGRIAERMVSARLHVPAHFEAEVLSALGRLHRAGLLTPDQVRVRVDRLAEADLVRHPVAPLLAPAWEARDRMRLVDALYVALADALGCALLTTDRRLAAVTDRADVIGMARVIRVEPRAVDPAAVDPAAVDPAAVALRDGRLVAFPTETVYGLGANALDPAAVARIFAAKGRPADNPVIVHAPDAETAWRVTTGPTPLALRLAEAFWPGPLTLVLPAADALPRAATAGLPSVAVRVPDHPVALALLRAAGVPVAAPSANRSGRPSPTTAAHVLDDLGDAVDVVVDGGPCRVGLESTVVDARGDVPVVLREGGISREQLLAVAGAGGVGSATGAEDLAASPGTRHRHYAPACRVVIAPVGGGAVVAGQLAGDGTDRRVGLIGPGEVPPGVVAVARVAGADELAARLYQALRDAEAAGVTDLVVEGVPETGIGRAVMDRLRRAAEGSTADRA